MRTPASLVLALVVGLLGCEKRLPMHPTGVALDSDRLFVVGPWPEVHIHDPATERLALVDALDSPCKASDIEIHSQRLHLLCEDSRVFTLGLDEVESHPASWQLLIDSAHFRSEGLQRTDAALFRIDHDDLEEEHNYRVLTALLRDRPADYTDRVVGFDRSGLMTANEAGDAFAFTIEVRQSLISLGSARHGNAHCRVFGPGFWHDIAVDDEGRRFAAVRHPTLVVFEFDDEGRIHARARDSLTFAPRMVRCWQ